MDWLEKFKASHGERLVFMALATFFGVGFLVAGNVWEIPELNGAGATLLIQVSALVLNKARSPEGSNNEEKPNESPSNPT